MLSRAILDVFKKLTRNHSVNYIVITSSTFAGRKGSYCTRVAEREKPWRNGSVCGE